MLIDEKTVESVLADLAANSELTDKLTSQFEGQYEDYLSYLDQEIFAILNAKEKDLIIFIHSVIVECFMRNNFDPLEFELADFFDLEEKMWSLYEDNLKIPFRERLDPFFKSIDEEELLAFIEDTLIDLEPEEDESTEEDEKEEVLVISSSGRDIVWNVSAAFVSLMSS